MGYKRETMKEAGYVYVRRCQCACGQHLLRDVDTGRMEIWANSKNHAGYAIKFKNTHLEFCRGASEIDIIAMS
jgi:hypothetical protein